MYNDFEQAEIKISYLESQVMELNEVVINQDKEIKKLSLLIYKLENRINNLEEESSERENKKPPHY